MKFRNLICGALLLMLSAQGCGPTGVHRHEDSASVDSIPDVDITSEALAWADSVTMSLSLQRRVAQLFMPAVYTTADDPNLTVIADYADRMGVGGLILLKGTLENAAAISDTIGSLSPYGMFIAVDAENGLAMRFSDAPEFVWNAQISDSADELELYDYGQELAKECRTVGINMVLGPVLDVLPSTGVMPAGSKRSFGADAGKISRIAIAYARGLEDAGVISVAKHFPGHGSAGADSHKRLAIVKKSRQDIFNTDLLPFKNYIAHGLSGIMAGHIYAPALDSVRRPASFSSVLLNDLLRKQMHFDGLVLTDALNMSGAGGYTAADAILAGADVVMAPQHTERSIAFVRDEVEAGRIPENVINDRCRRILFYKYIKGIAPGTQFYSRIKMPRKGFEVLMHRDAENVKRSLIGA